MFASAWQLLTAIFFLSALTKLIYKLIKEVDRRPASSHPAAATFQQAAPAAEPEVEAEGHLEFATAAAAVDLHQQQQQLRHRRSSLTQISWSSPASPSSSSLSSSSTWNSLNSWAAGRHSQQQQQQQRPSQEAQDSDEEELVFEEALSFVLAQATGGPTRSQLDEERRLQEARWLTRQLFRRQLNRLSAGDQSSQSEPLGLLGEEEAEAEVAEEEPANEDHEQLVEEEHGDEKRLATEQTQDFGSINFAELESLSSASTSSSSSSQATRSSAYSDRKWSTFNLSCLVAEVFLLEPVKLTLSILSGTFAIFCGFLDFIEGIEHSAPDERGGAESGTGARARQATSLPTGANNPGGRSYPKRAATAAQQVRRQAQAARSQAGPRQQPEVVVGEQPRSNYFHRRYFSRRSLSAALLSDDQDQVAGS